MPEASLSTPSPPYTRKPRIARSHSVLWLLHRVLAKVRERKRMALFYRHVRLPHSIRRHQRPDILRTRWPLAVNTLHRPNQNHRPFPRDTSRGAYGGPSLERPRSRTRRILAQPKGCRLYIWSTSCQEVSGSQLHVAYSTRTSVMSRGLSGSVR